MNKYNAPWIVRRFPDGLTEVTDATGQGVCDNQPCYPVALHPDHADLIAAAPDMLEALQALSSLYDTDEGCKSLPEYINAVAAINKALGNV